MVGPIKGAGLDLVELTSLRKSIMHNNLKALEKFLQSNVNFKAVDRRGWTCLHFAVHYRNLDAVKLIIAYSGILTQELLEMEDKKFRTPLLIALDESYFYFNAELVEYLVKVGSNVHKKLRGKSILYLACEKQFNVDSLKLLIEYGADPNAAVINQYRYFNDVAYELPLHRSILECNEDCDLFLLNQTTLCHFDAFQALKLAIYKLKSKTVVAIVTIYPNIAKQYIKKFPTSNAVARFAEDKQWDVVKKLVHVGFNIDLMSSINNPYMDIHPPVFYAVGNPDLLELLLSKMSVHFIFSLINHLFYHGTENAFKRFLQLVLKKRYFQFKNRTNINFKQLYCLPIPPLDILFQYFLDIQPLEVFQFNMLLLSKNDKLATMPNGAIPSLKYLSTVVIRQTIRSNHTNDWDAHIAVNDGHLPKFIKNLIFFSYDCGSNDIHSFNCNTECPLYTKTRNSLVLAIPKMSKGVKQKIINQLNILHCLITGELTSYTFGQDNLIMQEL